MRDGDTLVVWKLGRLGRSVKDLLDFAGGLNERGIGFVSLTDAIDSTTVSGRFFFNVMASLAQMERELMVERTQAGLQVAREQGRGRRPQTRHDGSQDPIRTETSQPRNTAAGSCQQPRCICSHPLPVGSGSRRC
ncbi:recombinase family protein [Arthrobacter sp. A5]|uniref:recombinase family protein n=1 Tax=Arthrobacter sp. A5 TaxID=576926 RepID=UPI003DAA186A